MKDNPLIQFIQEMFLRLSAKSPTFFKVWQIITGIPVLIIALPEALRMLHIDLPQVFNQHIQTIVSWAATSAFFISLMPSQSKVAGVDESGNLLKKTDDKKLPFTDNQENKAAVKAGEAVKQMETIDLVIPTDKTIK